MAVAVLGKAADRMAPVLLVVTECKSNGKLPGCQVYHISKIGRIMLCRCVTALLVWGGCVRVWRAC